MRGIQLGKLFGIPIQINYSFLALPIILLLLHGFWGLVLLAVVFISILFHELGHALVARRMNVPILGIDLHFFGGAAKMGRLPSSPKKEILIAIAGPAVSFSLALVALVLFLLTRFYGFQHLFTINLLLGAFNLLPALPMDGGRVLRAALSRRMGMLKATNISVKVNRVVVIGLGIIALVNGNFFLLGLTVLLWMLGSAELQSVQHWRQYGGQGFYQASRRSTDIGANGNVEVLDSMGRVLNYPSQNSTPSFTIEQQRNNGIQRLIVRDPMGRVIFITEQT